MEITSLTVDVILKALLILSLVINFTTEGVKKLLDEKGAKYSSNFVAVCVAVVSAVLMSIIYCLLKNIQFSLGLVAVVVMLIWVSFLIATVGYDKVMQLIKQITSK